ELFDRLDRDMDQGWQMSREWVDHPNRLQRCQIVADKLLTALEKENDRLGMMMAGYILSRLPSVDSVELDIQGEMQNHHFLFRDDGDGRTDASGHATSDFAPSDRNLPRGLSRMEAMAQAGQDVTKVFKVGKAWRFSVYDHASGTWQESPLIATEQEAERLRQAAVKERYEQLIGA
ncbi:MAG: hypothetical protein PVH47_08615, partial [Thiohalocapsa sp.]